MNRRILGRIAVALAPILMLTGCGIDFARVPIPGNTVPGESYQIHVDFSSALNLPARAEVVVDGVQAGLVTDIGLTPEGAAKVTLTLEQGATLPVSTQAALRQDTLLGDIYVVLIPPEEPSGAILQSGDTIPLEDTKAATNIESTLRGLATVITGGNIARLAQTLTDFNAGLPDDPDRLAELMRVGNAALTDIADGHAEVSQILAASRKTLEAMADNRKGLNLVLEAGPPRLEKVSTLVYNVVDLILNIGHMTEYIARLLEPLVGDLRYLLESLDPMVKAVAYADLSLRDYVRSTRHILRDKMLPLITSPDSSVTITPAGRAPAGLDLILRSAGSAP